MQKVISWLLKITVEPLMSHGLFYGSPLDFDRVNYITVYGGSESSQNASKIS